MRKLIVTVLLAVVGYSQLSLAGDNPIVIGGSLALSGKYAAMGEMQQKGFRLWEQAVNREGGILGRQVKVVIHDDKSDKQTAVGIYRRLIEQDKVDLLFGPYSSGITGAVMPMIEKSGYSILASGAAADSLWQKGYRNLFGLFTPSSRYAVGFLEMIAMKGIERVAIISADDPFSGTMAAGSRRWAKSFGLNVALERTFKKGTRDLTTVAQQVAAAKVPAVLVCGHFNESVDMSKALKKIGYRPRAYFAAIGPAIERYHQMLGKDADHAFSSSQWETSLVYRPGDKALFLDPFLKQFGKKPSYHAADAFAAGQILAAAVEKVGSLDRGKLREALATLNYVSIIGRYGVDKSGMQVKHFPINVQWQDGVKQVVWPEEVATAKPHLEKPAGQ